MNKQGNEKRLDELISQTINTEKPRFDAEKWKQKYPEEFQSLLSRAAKGDSARLPSILKVILKSPLTKLAAAAVIILAVSFFSAHQDSSEQADTTTVSKITKSPVEMMTAMSLNIAYRKGGIEEVEKQYNEAFKLLGPRPATITVTELLAEYNGT
jgi:hypothetical protein